MALVRQQTLSLIYIFDARLSVKTPSNVPLDAGIEIMVFRRHGADMQLNVNIVNRALLFMVS